MLVTEANANEQGPKKSTRSTVHLPQHHNREMRGVRHHTPLTSSHSRVSSLSKEKKKKERRRKSFFSALIYCFSCLIAVARARAAHCGLKTLENLFVRAFCHLTFCYVALGINSILQNRALPLTLSYSHSHKHSSSLCWNAGGADRYTYVSHCIHLFMYLCYRQM